MLQWALGRGLGHQSLPHSVDACARFSVDVYIHERLVRPIAFSVRTPPRTQIADVHVRGVIQMKEAGLELPSSPLRTQVFANLVTTMLSTEAVRLTTRQRMTLWSLSLQFLAWRCRNPTQFATQT